MVTKKYEKMIVQDKVKRVEFSRHQKQVRIQEPGGTENKNRKTVFYWLFSNS